MPLQFAQEVRKADEHCCAAFSPGGVGTWRLFCSPKKNAAYIRFEMSPSLYKYIVKWFQAKNRSSLFTI